MKKNIEIFEKNKCTKELNDYIKYSKIYSKLKLVKNDLKLNQEFKKIQEAREKLFADCLNKLGISK